MIYTKDEYGQIVNGPSTFEQAALDAVERGSVVLNWTDEQGSLLNILLAFDPTRVGAPGGLVDPGPGKLWVGIAGHGCFGFSTSAGYVSPDYATEKLGVRGATAEAVAQLVTEVRTQIALDLTRGEVTESWDTGRGE